MLVRSQLSKLTVTIGAIKVENVPIFHEFLACPDLHLGLSKGSDVWVTGPRWSSEWAGFRLTNVSNIQPELRLGKVRLRWVLFGYFLSFREKRGPFQS